MHVIVKLLCLALLALSLSLIRTFPLICLAGLLSTFALVFYQKPFIHMLQRMKWLLLMLIMLYAFSTPGEYIQIWRLPFRPTYDGLVAGLTQMLNLIVMLSGLAVVLSTTRRAQLIGGLYQLLFPFKFLRFNPEKFAIRTWLTMHYVETRKPVMQVKSYDLEALLHAQFAEDPSADAIIAIEVAPFRLHDYLLMMGMLIGCSVWIAN
ncbi:MAG: hypothetical protein B7X95_01225 [Methylophilaceae bacterium 17-44-8]|jgi:energy-coupling factor transport system permease protein|nr:MAG: hypothetical protein B7Y48_03130 [Methylophilales bacterium 28-44-11]OYZ03314.1 MAG: hypothetical protein B7Y32_04960 [Methylophilales bacterium 16-45-7]OZA06794.1 MAG: hypothetical protein B7X95_01225 [Methylophilaceae bacterium 17-44-8]